MEQINKRLMNWASILEDNTRDQAVLAAEMPFIYPHLALMPDAHLGKGATVGSVIPTKGAIMPAAVGVDIGCGMMAVRTQFTLSDLPHRDYYHHLREAIEESIPMGQASNATLQPTATKRVEELTALAERLDFDPASYLPSWDRQLGSLGGGNHFIEVSLDEQDRVWLFLHSGSRGVGNKIAQHHIKQAQQVAERYFIDLPDRDLAYLIEGTPEFEAYIRQLTWAQRFAYLNREEMMDRVVNEFGSWMFSVTDFDHLDARPSREQEINCHHNYTVQEKHFGQKVWLSRKGAISAKRGELGLIPGSMGTRSYVVSGLGNRLALESSPHGAGRAYGRKHAERTFTMEQLEASMGDIEWSHSEKFLDEIPQAYKDIDIVMEDASDLVEKVHELRQIINCKGTS